MYLKNLGSFLAYMTFSKWANEKTDQKWITKSKTGFYYYTGSDVHCSGLKVEKRLSLILDKLKKATVNFEVRLKYISCSTAKSP